MENKSDNILIKRLLSSNNDEELKRKQRQLAEAERIAHLGSWEWDILNDKIYWSEELYNIYDIEPGFPVRYELFLEHIHPEDRNMVNETVQKAYHTLKPFFFEHKIISGKGIVKWLFGKGKVITNDTNTPVRMMGIAQDITEKKQIEENQKKLLKAIESTNQQLLKEIKQRKKVEKRLQLEKEFSESLVKNSTCGIVAFDKDQTYTEWNPVMEKITGIKREQVAGKKIFDVFPLDKNTENGNVFLRVIEGERIFIKERQYLDKPGWYEAQLVPIFDKRGKITGGLAIVQDITERKKAEEELLSIQVDLENRVNQRTAEITQINKELKEFAYVVSHDLKAPLRAISTITDFLIADESKNLSEEGVEQLNTLKGRVGRLHSMIEGILKYSKAGTLSEEKEFIDLNELVKDTIQLLKTENHIEIKIENTLPSIIANRTLMQQVYLNLLSNASKYIDKPKGHIRIGVSDDQDSWRFYVSDNGPGIEEKHFDRIFGIFQTLNPKDEIEGSGIGLTIVKKIVETQGGKVWLDSELKKGTTFYFTLPKVKKNES